MPAFGRLAIKDPSSGSWISNLSLDGLKVRWDNGESVVWVRMTRNNTFVRNPNYAADNPQEPEWISCV